METSHYLNFLLQSKSKLLGKNLLKEMLLKIFENNVIYGDFKDKSAHILLE